MTEKEKRNQGILYDPNHDPELLREMVEAKDICYEYNRILPSKEQEREDLLRSFLGRCSSAFCIQPPFWCDYGYNIELGENFFANHNCVFLDGAKITFGDNVFVAPDCSFYTAGHPIDVEQRNAGLEYAYPIVIGSNVWIGGGVKVMPGVTIGNNVVIGGGSVVVRDIPDNVVAAGNPCRILRPITDADRQKDYTWKY